MRKGAGEEAERIAYLFHTINRPNTLHNFVQSTGCSSWRDEDGDGMQVELEGREGAVWVSEREAWQLVALECANLLEQVRDFGRLNCPP